MFFDYWKKRQALERQHQIEKPLMLEAGMSEEDVNDIFRLDWRQFYRDAQYATQLTGYLETENEMGTYDQEFAAGFMDDLSDPQLHAALSNLKPDEREIVLLHVVDGIPLKLVATLRGQPYDALAKRYKRAVSKLREKF